MQLITSIIIQAAETAVWQILTDPQVTSTCMPGLVEWEILEPARRFRIVVAWGESGNNGGGLRIPAIIEWTELIPPTQLCINIRLFLGNNTLDIAGTAQLQEIENGQTRLEISSSFDAPTPVMAQMVRNALAKILKPFFHCLRNQAEQLSL
ncbi:MAG: SRPBCC family protein [Chloroflexota bacterium]|nr:SRPBCC family protein [Ardenticatenaceae bacterium]